jgi:hypothetical protein
LPFKSRRVILSLCHLYYLCHTYLSDNVNVRPPAVMDTPQSTISDSEATKIIDTGLKLLDTRTTYTQFAQIFRHLRSVAYNTQVSARIQIRAQEELEGAGRRGIEWFAKFPAVVSSSSGKVVLGEIKPQLLRDMADFMVSTKMLFAA